MKTSDSLESFRKPHLKGKLQNLAHFPLFARKEGGECFDSDLVNAGVKVPAKPGLQFHIARRLRGRDQNPGLVPSYFMPVAMYSQTPQSY